MTKEAKAMINMAMSIAEINGVLIDRMDLQRHTSKYGMEWYHLDVWYTDSKEITIREDCTIVIKDQKTT